MPPIINTSNNNKNTQDTLCETSLIAALIRSCILVKSDCSGVGAIAARIGFKST